MDTFAFYSKVINEAIDHSTFWRYYFISPYCLDYESSLNDSTYITCGATRGCIVSDNCDEVVKFVFEEGENDECEHEVEVYQEAVREGLADCFVPCHYIGTFKRTVRAMDWYQAGEQVNNSQDADDWDDVVENEADMETHFISLRLYAYPRVTEDVDSSNLSEDERDFYYDHKSPLSERDNVVGVNFLHYLGEEGFLILSDFCRRNDVNDLHNGNVGRMNGHIVLMDYAGYWK